MEAKDAAEPAFMTEVALAKSYRSAATGFPSIDLAARPKEVRLGLAEHNPERAWHQDYDPTLVNRRVLSELSYESHDNDKDYWKLENSLRWGIPLSERLALGLQALIPVKWDNTATSDTSGIGDLELRTGVVGRISATQRYGVGLNAKFDTASDSALGDNALILRPIAAFRWDVASRVNVGLNVEYSFTPLEEGENDSSALELKFPLVVKLTDDWSAAATYKPRWNLLTNDNRHRLELGATRLFGSDRQYALSFLLELPLSADNLDYKLTSGFAWHF